MIGFCKCRNCKAELGLEEKNLGAGYCQNFVSYSLRMLASFSQTDLFHGYNKSPNIPGPSTSLFHLFIESQINIFSRKKSNWVSMNEENTPTPSSFANRGERLACPSSGLPTDAKSGKPYMAREARSPKQCNLLNHVVGVE